MKLTREQFRAMANLMLNDVKLEAIMDSVGISSRTAYVWRMKVYTAAFEIQKSSTLSGKVWLDEALIPVNGGIAYRFPDGRCKRQHKFVGFRQMNMQVRPYLSFFSLETPRGSAVGSALSSILSLSL